MATVRKRGKEQWQAQVRIKGYPPRSKTFSTRTDAERWAKLQESEILVGIPQFGILQPNKDSTSIALAEYLNRYEVEVSPKKKSHRKELSFLRRLKAIPLAQSNIWSIKAQDISQWRDSRLREVSPSSVTRELALVSHVFTVAAKEWGLEGLANPVLAIRKPKLPPGRTRRPTLLELDKLIAASESPELPAIVSFALETGMRRSEICALKWEDVDLNHSTLIVRLTKNGQSRIIPLSRRARPALEQRFKGQAGRVFNLRPDSLSQAFERACRRAKLNDLRFHDLRHEATSRFFEKGLSVMETALITGHKDLRMLLRYTHLRPQEILAKLNETEFL